MEEYLISCRDLGKSFPGCRALNGINLELPRGRIIGLLGPNGSGKSTFLKLCNGLLTPDRGELLVCGSRPGVESKKHVSYLPERSYLNDWMTVEQMIGFFKDFYADFEEARAYDMLARLAVDPAKRMKTMSKGTKEKVQLILVTSPPRSTAEAARQENRGLSSRKGPGSLFCAIYSRLSRFLSSCQTTI